MEKSGRTNADLKAIYNAGYSNDIYGNFFTFSDFDMFREMVGTLPRWAGLEAIDIGSGQGEVAAMARLSGAKRVVGVDYSEEAVRIARSRFNIEGLEFVCSDFRDYKGQFDVAILTGVLEHFDDPYGALDYITKNLLKPGGKIITSSPSFLNPRGFVWMTLQLLFDVPMSLTDVHFLSPFDFEEYCSKHGYKLSYKSLYHSLAWGERTIVDFKKRLTNALRDAKMDNSKVDRLLGWLSKTIPYATHTDSSGALIVYLIET